MVDTKYDIRIYRIMYYSFSVIYSLIKIYYAFFFISSDSDDFFFTLGLPNWLSLELGVGSFLGGLIIITPFLPIWLKEWAYIAFGITEFSALIAGFSVKGFTLFSFFPFVSIAIWIVSYHTFHIWTNYDKNKRSWN